ncbi:MAG: glycoside hydrolase [Actinomycetota bacterium]|nr:glycoside hydrolase [Actinomycetota bacterium]
MRVPRKFIVPLLVGVLAAAFGGTSYVDAKSFARPSGGAAMVHRDGKVIDAKSAASAKTSWIGHTSLEPTIAIEPSGDIYVTAADWTHPAVTGGATDIVRSSDGGETWSFVTPKILDQRRQHVTLDPYVHVDDLDGDNARIFTIDLTVACSYMSFSDDHGESWTTNPLACGRPVNDHHTVFSGPPVNSTTIGYPNILYYCWNDVGTSSCGKSLDGGITWHPTGAPAFLGYDTQGEGEARDNLCGGLHGHGIVGPEGTVYLPREYCNRPYISVSHDEGVTWTNYRVAKMPASGGSDTSVAVDRKGNLYYLWLGQDDRLPYLAVSRDKGETWSKPVAVGPPQLKEANLPSIVARGVGKIALVYYGSTNSPFRPCPEDDPDCNDGANYLKTTWNGYLTISANALDKSPTFYTGLVNDPSDPLVRQRCGPGRCYNVLDFIDVGIGPDGIAYAAFVDVCIPKGDSPCTERTPVNAWGGRGRFEGLVTRMVGGPALN